MKRAALLRLDPIPPKECEKGIIYAQAEVKELDDRYVLEIGLYDGNGLGVRYFADAEKEERAAYSVASGKWSTLKLENAAADFAGGSRQSYWCNDNYYEWATKEDREIALDYLGTHSIDYWEYKCDSDNRMKAEGRKQKRIQEAVEEFDVVPEAVTEWIDTELLPEHVIFTRKPSNGMQTYHCTACGGRGQTKTRLKINRQNVCPACGAEVRGRTAGTTIEKEIPVIVFQKNEAGTKYCEKQFKAVKFWDDDGETTELHIYTIAIMKAGYSYGIVYYGESERADEFAQSWCQRNTGRTFRESWVYPENMPEILQLMNEEHSGMDLLIRQRPVNINRWMIDFNSRDQRIEYMNKRGLYHYMADIIQEGHFSVSTREHMEYLRTHKEAANRIRKLDGSYAMTEWIYQYDNIGLKDEDLLFLQEKKLLPDELPASALGIASVTKVCNYLRKYMRKKEFLIWWKDYLAMAEQSGQDLHDSIVLFPKDLERRHNEQIQRRLEQQERETRKRMEKHDKALDERIREHLPEITRFSWTDGTYSMIPATCCTDLRDESLHLHHCVGTSDRYMLKMADGQSWILFLRKSETPDEAYYTVEIDMKNDSILQWYSAYDRKPDQDTIQKLLNRFLADLKKAKRKENVEAAE